MNNLVRTVTRIGLVIGLAGPLYVFANSSMDSTEAQGPTTVSKGDLEFLGKAAQTDMTEMQAAAIAKSRALAIDTKYFAGTLAADHEVNSDDLRVLAALKGVTLPTHIDSKHQSELDDLQNVDAKKFDAAYADAMTKGHKDAVAFFEKASKKSRDVDIRNFAMSTLPTLQQHLDMAKHLNAKS